MKPIVALIQGQTVPLRWRALAMAAALTLPAPAFAAEAAGGAVDVAESDAPSVLERALDAVTGLFSSTPDNSDAGPEQAVADLPPIPIDQPHPIGDLAYGDLLFEYYQERYFSAITRILVAQERGVLQRDSEHAQIVLGALYVSYGLLDQGEAIFRELLASNSTPAGADEAWYQLARIYYKRGEIQRARDILTQDVQAPLETRPTEHTLLQVLCHIRLGEADQAKALLPYLKDDESLSVFVRFNLGSAFAQLGELDQANRYFTTVSEASTSTEEDRVLRDQSSLALGVSYLRQEKWQEARAILERIRLYGPVANRGLLALGWTHFNDGDQPAALTPWLELSERDLADPAVQEALLNIPYVFEQQGALQEALNRYRDAFRVFRRQRNALDQVKQEIMQPDWIETLSPVPADTRNVMGELPEFTLPANHRASRHLYLYFASNEFQRLHRDYRELQRLYMVLVHWQRQMPSFNQMIATNVERLDKLGPRSEKAIQQSQKFYAYARVKLDDYGARLDQIIANEDLAGSANVPQLTQKERLDAAEATLQALGEPEMYEEEWTKLRLLKGLLMWDLNATAIDRRWEMTKDRIAIDNLLVELEDRIRAVDAARNLRLDRFHGFETRILNLDQRMVDLQAGIAQALRHNRHYMQAVAISIIEQHQTQLDRMRAKTLLSIARLQDRGYMQERERQSQSQKTSLTVELTGKVEQDEGTTQTGDNDIPVQEKPAARNLSDVIRRIFAD